MLTGSCLCGAVAFRIEGAASPVSVCHCSQCRKTSGHFWAATRVAPDDLVMIRDDGLRWYRSSADTERGFCGTCGSSLFWRTERETQISIGAGTLDPPTGLHIAQHIFLDDKSDYVVVEDGPAHHRQA